MVNRRVEMTGDLTDKNDTAGGPIFDPTTVHSEAIFLFLLRIFHALTFFFTALI